MTCEDCNGHGFHYSDNGPAPKRIECAECYGVGSWEEEDDMPATLDQQLADLCAIYGLEAITISSYAPKDRPGHVSVSVHRNSRSASDDLYTGDDITAAFKRALERLNEGPVPTFAPLQVAA